MIDDILEICSEFIFDIVHAVNEVYDEEVTGDE